MPRPLTALAFVLALLLLVDHRPALAEEADPASPEALKKAMASDSVEARLLAARSAKDVQHESLVQPLLRLLKDKELPVRDAALDALVHRETPKDRKTAAKGIATALLQPLPREPDETQRAREELVVPALHDLAQEVTIKDLLDDVHPEAPADLVKARLRAVANVPSKAAIEALIDYGARRRAGDGHRSAVREALRYATGHTLPGDPDQWRKWWRENKDNFDVEAAARARTEAKEGREDRERRREDRKERRREGKGGAETPDDS